MKTPTTEFLSGKVDALVALSIVHVGAAWPAEYAKEFVRQMETRLEDSDVREAAEREMGADYANGYEAVIQRFVDQIKKEVGAE